MPIWARAERGGGCLPGTMASFLMLEAADCARARGAVPWCGVSGLASRQTRRQQGDVTRALEEAWNELAEHPGSGPAGIISGATGIAPATEEERAALATLSSRLGGAPVRTTGSMFGHGMESSFPFNLGLAALALRHGRLFPRLAGDPADASASL